MPKVYETGRYGTTKNIPLSIETLQALNAYVRKAYLVDSPGYVLEDVVRRYLSTAAPIPSDQGYKFLVVAPRIGPYDFSAGELVSIAEDDIDPILDGLVGLGGQIGKGKWIADRALWEVAIHEFIAPLDGNNVAEDVDTVTLGEFWDSEKDSLKKILNSGKLSKAPKLLHVGYPTSPFDDLKYVPASKLIFSSLGSSVFSYHRVMPEPLRSLTRAQVAELLQSSPWVDTEKRVGRDQAIAEVLADARAPGTLLKREIAIRERIKETHATSVSGFIHSGVYRLD